MEFGPLDPPPRTLMGPGPSDIHPRVLRAMGSPTIGHMDPAFIAMMDETKSLLQRLYGTNNPMTFPVSATGSAGMECCMVNVIEPGDRVVIAQNGVFGGRMADIAGRLGAEVVTLEIPFGEAIPADKVKAAIDGKPTKLVGAVHAETSTGVHTPLAELAELAHQVDALFMADCVTSLGGQEVALDQWGVDLAYSGTQKCLSCPPGLAPVSFSPRAIDVLKARKSKVVSWYLDLTMLLNYWGGERSYHHTAPINMVYGLREALMLVFEEGLDAVFARHLKNHQALVAGIEAMGLKMLVDPAHRLAQLNTVVIPDGVDDGAVHGSLLRDFNMEIGGGLGALKGKVWRVGLMGHASRRENVILFLSALEAILARSGASIGRGAAEAALAVYDA